MESESEEEAGRDYSTLIVAISAGREEMIRNAQDQNFDEPLTGGDLLTTLTDDDDDERLKTQIGAKRACFAFRSPYSRISPTHKKETIIIRLEFNGPLRKFF